MLRRKHRERCNWMYWNIITQAEGQERSKDSISTVYLANLIETCDRCAVFRPSLGKVREAHLERLKQRREDAVDKVLQLNPTNDAHIETIAQDAVSHYHSLTHNELIVSTRIILCLLLSSTEKPPKLLEGILLRVVSRRQDCCRSRINFNSHSSLQV